MHNILLTLYVLVWPLLAAGVLALISTAFIREFRSARKKGHDLI